MFRVGRRAALVASAVHALARAKNSGDSPREWSASFARADAHALKWLAPPLFPDRRKSSCVARRSIFVAHEKIPVARGLASVAC
jgi:hypothetical protein